MATWRINAHNVTGANEALRKVTLWSSEDRASSATNYYIISVGIGTSDGKVDVVGEYDGNTDVLTGNAVRDLTGGVLQDRLLREGDSLIIDVESVGSPALTASGLTVEWHLELVGGNSTAFKPAFQTGGYIPDQRVRAAVGGLEQQLNSSGVTAWTVAVPLMDPVEDSTLAQAVSHVFQGRIQRDSATQISLQRYTGDKVVVAGGVVSIGSAGLTCLSTDLLIDAAGGASTAPAASALLYYAYVSGPGASYRPNSLRLCLTAPTLGENGYYLNTSGNAQHWRFAGWVRTNATPNFVDTEQNRDLINYYNRRKLPGRIKPGYQDDNADDTFTSTATSYEVPTGGEGSYIDNGEDSVPIRLWSVMSVTAGNAAYAGIGDNSATAAAAETECDSTVEFGVGCHYNTTPTTPARRTINFLVAVSAGTGTYRADGARKGSTADPIASGIMFEVMG